MLHGGGFTNSPFTLHLELHFVDIPESEIPELMNLLSNITYVLAVEFACNWAIDILVLVRKDVEF